MASKNSIRMVVGAGLALAAGVAFADTTYLIKQTFEEGATSVGDWSDGTVEAVSVERAVNTPSVGSALGTTASAKSGSLVGDATCTVAAGGSGTQADFLVKVSEKSEGLATDELGLARIAVAVGDSYVADSNETQIPVYVCCGTTPTWVKTSAVVTKDEWARLSLVFDYDDGTCSVNVNGLPATALEGYNSAVLPEGVTVGVSKYPLITGSTTAIDSLKFSGLAYLDDIVVTPATAELPAVVAVADRTIANVVVTAADLSKWGVTRDTADTVSLDPVTEMTVFEKLEAGLTPDGNTAFAAESMSLKKVGDTVTGSLDVPFQLGDTNAANRDYYIVFNDDTANPVPATKGDVANGKQPITFTFPTDMGNVLKFTVQVKTTAPTSGN